jgi:hypothetical protein
VRETEDFFQNNYLEIRTDARLDSQKRRRMDARLWAIASGGRFLLNVD